MSAMAMAISFMVSFNSNLSLFFVVQMCCCVLMIRKCWNLLILISWDQHIILFTVVCFMKLEAIVLDMYMFKIVIFL